MRKIPQILAGSRRAGRLRVLTAWQLLSARAEAARLQEETGEGYALALAACIVARSLRCGTGEMLLKRRSAEEIEALAQRYWALCRAVSPAPGDEQALAALMQELTSDGYARLYYKVLRAFGVLPSERRAKELTDGELLFLAANLRLDEQTGGEGLVNPAFDQSRFEALKGGAR